MSVAKIDDRMYVVRDDYPLATSFKPIKWNLMAGYFLLA